MIRETLMFWLWLGGASDRNGQGVGGENANGKEETRREEVGGRLSASEPVQKRAWTCESMQSVM